MEGKMDEPAQSFKGSNRNRDNPNIFIEVLVIRSFYSIQTTKYQSSGCFCNLEFLHLSISSWINMVSIPKMWITKSKISCKALKIIDIVSGFQQKKIGTANKWTVLIQRVPRIYLAPWTSLYMARLICLLKLLSGAG